MTITPGTAYRLLSWLARLRAVFESIAYRIECWEMWIRAHRGRTAYDDYRDENPRHVGLGGMGSGPVGEHVEPLPEHLCKTCRCELPPGRVSGVKFGYCSEECEDA